MDATEIDELEREARVDEHDELRWNRHLVLELIGEIRLLQAEKKVIVEEHHKCLGAKLRLEAALANWDEALNPLQLMRSIMRT